MPPVLLENVSPSLLLPPAERGGVTAALAGGVFELGDRCVGTTVPQDDRVPQSLIWAGLAARCMTTNAPREHHSRWTVMKQAMKGPVSISRSY